MRSARTTVRRPSGLGWLVGWACLAAACLGPPEPERVERQALAPWIDRAIVESLEGVEGDTSGLSGPVRLPSGDDLFLPAGTRTSLAVLTPESPELRFEGVVARERAELEVEIETEHGPFATRTVRSSPDTTVRVELPPDQPTRVSFTVTAAAGGDGTAGGKGGIVLRRAAIWGAPDELGSWSESAPQSPPPVVIYLIDTLRRDRLGCYGYDKPITPEIDAFAARATLFEDAVGQSSWTKASVASALTGVWPPVHGAISWTQRLPDDFDTLAELLERSGYTTGAFSTNPNIIPKMGFDQGFQHFSQLGRIESSALNDLIAEWLDDVPPERPFFLYAQPIDPHSAYNPPPEFLARHAPGVDPHGWNTGPKWKWPVKALPTLISLYDAEVAANDDSFGKLLDDLEERGLYDSALIVLTSDHGEEFQEHGGWRHGNHLYAETLDVPLIIKFPDQVEGRRVTGAAQHIDILPTVLDVVGLPTPSGVEGMSLAGRATTLPRRLVYSHLRLGAKAPHVTLIDGDWKLMQRRRTDGIDEFLFNLADDPREQTDLSAEFPLRTAAMRALLEARYAAAKDEGGAETVEIDAELEKELRALGYLQ